jgi:hypothetical protein
MNSTFKPGWRDRNRAARGLIYPQSLPSALREQNLITRGRQDGVGQRQNGRVIVHHEDGWTERPLVVVSGIHRKKWPSA